MTPFTATAWAAVGSLAAGWMLRGSGVDWQQIEKSALSLAERTSEEATGTEGSSKLNLRRLGHELGVDRLEMRNMEASGLTVDRGNGGFTVFLNAQHAPTRRRFTFAHELAHIMLRPILGARLVHHRVFAFEQDPEGDRIEGLCDMMASALLMPTRSARPVLEECRWSATAVKRLAMQFDVSYEAAARRFLVLHPEQRALLIWKPPAEPNQPPTARCVPCPTLGDTRAEFSRNSGAGRLVAEEAFNTARFVTSYEDVDVWVDGSEFVHLPLCLVESKGWRSQPHRYVYSFVAIPPGAVAKPTPKKRAARSPLTKARDIRAPASVRRSPSRGGQRGGHFPRR